MSNPGSSVIFSDPVRKFVRFLFVGALNTLVGYGMFAIFVAVDLRVELALLLATVLGIFFNYLTTKTLVFSTSDKKPLLPFIVVYGVFYVLNVAMLRGLLALGLSPILAQLMIIPFVAIGTFVAFQKFVFKEKRQ